MQYWLLWYNTGLPVPSLGATGYKKSISSAVTLHIYMCRGHVSECSAMFVFCIVNIAPRAMVTLMSLLLFHTEHAKFSSACLELYFVTFNFWSVNNTNMIDVYDVLWVHVCVHQMPTWAKHTLQATSWSQCVWPVSRDAKYSDDNHIYHVILSLPSHPTLPATSKSHSIIFEYNGHSMLLQTSRCV